METLMSATIKELDRNRELLELYNKIPVGKFSSMIIKETIKRTEKAISDDDTISLLKCYKDLKESK